ncbi:MAG: type IX secretion system membrane protein PorP/SprF [Cytophagaceae bacterium]
MRIYIIASCLFFSVCKSDIYAQTGPALPIQFLQFFKTYNLMNPASIGRISPGEISLGNKSLLGDFSSIRTSYVHANAQLNASSAAVSRQVIGLTFINDREGSFINTNRASLLYAYHLPISAHLKLNAGAAMGFLNYAYSPSNISAGGSAFAPNADIGLWLHNPDFNIGISGNQIIPAKLTPIAQTYTIRRYYNFIADKKFPLNPYVSLTTAFMYRSYKDFNSADLALILLIHDNLSVALAYKYKKGASISGGLEDIRLGSHVLKVMFSYYSPLTSITSYNPQSLEFSFQFIPAAKHLQGGRISSGDEE